MSDLLLLAFRKRNTNKKIPVMNLLVSIRYKEETCTEIEGVFNEIFPKTINSESSSISSNT